jgi:hypothetical protein
MELPVLLMRRCARVVVWGAAAAIAAVLAPTVSGQLGQPGPLMLHLTDYAEAPMTGAVDGVSNQGALARINVMREEPGGRDRFFLCDLNGPLYIVDKAAKTFVTYLDFNGAEGKAGMFKRFSYPGGFATGLIGFTFDPRYTQIGRFYTIHMEDQNLPGSAVPDTAGVPGLNVAGYTASAPVVAPGTTQKQTVLVEWTDSNPANTTFEGAARELLRIETNSHIHPMGDATFSPVAREGDAEWGVMYIGSGDGGSGEQTRPEMRHSPQRLDQLVGKLLRIIPDLSLHATSSTVSENGRYRIPRDNPFASVEGARKEIWAVGLRNPHRLTWTIDPARPDRNRLIVNSIGLRTWETVNVVRKGANYGYSEREGNERLRLDNTTEALPSPDEIPVRISNAVIRGTVVPTYPVAQYPHKAGGGDAIAGGFLYRGKAFPALRGKYLLADISTGFLWYLDYDEMLKADDGKPETLATLHPVDVVLDGARRPAETAPAAEARPRSPMWRIVEAAYHARGGKDPDLPGRSTVSGAGRVDLRFAEDADGEPYIISKSDGMIRRVTGATQRGE